MLVATGSAWAVDDRERRRGRVLSRAAQGIPSITGPGCQVMVAAEGVAGGQASRSQRLSPRSRPGSRADLRTRWRRRSRARWYRRDRPSTETGSSAGGRLAHARCQSGRAQLRRLREERTNLRLDRLPDFSCGRVDRRHSTEAWPGGVPCAERLRYCLAGWNAW